MHMNLSPSLDGDGFIDTVAKPDIIIIIITHTHSDVLDIVIITIFASQPSLDLGLSFSNEYVLLQRGTPGQIFQKCVFWLPLSNEGSRRC